MKLRLLTWNLYHGRDHPPDETLFTWRSRLLRPTERGERYAQVNRSLYGEFAEVLRRLEWDVLLLQEARPRWFAPLARDLGAQDSARVLTSRNSLPRLRALGAWLNPDLIASNEGGSNQLLVRAPWRIAGTPHVYTLAERPERRRMLFARLRADDGRELAVANLHASLPRLVPDAAEQVLAAAARADEWAGDLPLVFGGDLNQRPDRAPALFDALEQRFGLAPPTAPRVIDHLLVRGIDLDDPPSQLPPETRDVRTRDGLLLQLSDHPCVAATASMR